MNRREYAVAVLESDGTALVTTHWGRAEDALKQFIASLQLAGHRQEVVGYHTGEAARQLQRRFAYTVMNPEFGTGAVEIMPPATRGEVNVH